MLIRFRVSNYRSIRDTVELNLETRVGQTTTVAAIFGANASGKTNLLDALYSAHAAVRDSHTQWRPSAPPPREPFALDSECVERPSVFEFDFAIDGIRYQYGFGVGPRTITDEWLYTYPEGRRRVLFERDGQDFNFGRGLRGSNRAVAELVRPNSLFVSAAATNNHEDLLPIYNWFDSAHFGGLRSGAPTDNEVTQELLESDDRAEIQSLLTLADLGISGVSVRKEQVDEDVAVLLETFVTSVAEKAGRDASRFDFSRTQSLIEFEHRNASGETTRIPYSEESRGTQMWFSHIGPLLRALHTGSLLVIDELDASLHPRLSAEIVRLFADEETNANHAQLVFSTHDTSLLSHLVGDGLEREQVWFTEKDDAGSTMLYPLTDFHPRKAEALERGYLLGRYGAVPIVDFTEIAERLKVRS